MITKIKLKNWKSHEDSELQFAAGTNGLVGIVGSGKTSILDAICFALFGTFPALQNRKLKLEDVIMKKPKNKNIAEVEVFLTLNGNNYSVKRIVEKKRGTSYSEIRKNGRMIESSGTKNVTAIVEKNLRVDYELFSKAIYSEQNAIDYFLTLGKGQRMKKIDELLMIDRFENARASAVKLTNKIIERRLGKQSTIDQLDINETKAALTELKKSIDNFETERTRLKNELEKISKKKKEANSEVANLKTMRNNYEKLMREYSSIESAINTTLEMIERAEKNLKDIDEELDMSSIEKMLQNQSDKIEEISSFLREKQAEYEKTQNELTESRANLGFLQREKINQLQREFDEKMKIKADLGHIQTREGEDVNEQVKNNRLALQKLIGEMEATRMKMDDLHEQLERLSDVEGTCPVCGTTLSEEHKIEIVNKKLQEVDDLKEKIEKARKYRITTEEKIQDLESAARKLDEMVKEISDLEQIKDELEKSRHMLTQHTKSVGTLSEQLQLLKDEIGIVKKELDTTTSTKQRMEIINKQIEDYEEQREKIEKLKKHRKQLKVSISKLEDTVSKGKLEQTEQTLRTLISNEKETEMKLMNLHDLMAERSTRLGEYKKALEVANKEKEEIERLNRLIKDLKIFTEALKQTQVELRKEFIEAVNYTMNKLWQTLYHYQDFISVRLAIEEGDYVLQLQERTTSWVNVEGAASGGERSIASLALRIAFALVLAPHLRLLVLDEPTANLDANSIKVLSTTLREGISEFIDQCFIITHDDAFEEAVTGIAYRLERDKGKDGTTKVVQIN